MQAVAHAMHEILFYFLRSPILFAGVEMSPKYLHALSAPRSSVGVQPWSCGGGCDVRVCPFSRVLRKKLKVPVAVPEHPPRGATGAPP